MTDKQATAHMHHAIDRMDAHLDIQTARLGLVQGWLDYNGARLDRLSDRMDRTSARLDALLVKVP